MLSQIVGLFSIVFLIYYIMCDILYEKFYYKQFIFLILVTYYIFYIVGAFDGITLDNCR